MPRQNTIVPLSLVAAMCLLSQVQATETPGTLRTNPFSNPTIGSVETATEAAKKATPVIVHELRGTMMAGKNSQANIGGVILAIGEEIDGYTLISVTLSEVVLNKDGEQKILSLDMNNRNPANE